VTASSTRTPIGGFDHVLEPGTSGWTILLLHGTGGDEHDLVPLGRQLAPGACLLSPRGRVREGGTINRFFARRAANDIDVEDLRVRSDELASFVETAAKAYDLDPSRIIALGYSNGANVALGMLLRHPELLRAAALLRPVLYDVPDPLPGLPDTPVLAAFGSHDPYSPPEEIDHLRSTLERAGAKLQVRVDPAAGHGLAAADLQAAAAWLSELLDPR
jgi:phospholipase/carboxylesterase